MQFQYLKSINNSKHKILEVYTQPPKKKIVVKKKILHQSMIFSVKKIKLRLDIQKNLNTSKEFNELKKSNPDVVLVAAYGKIIPSNI